MILRFVNPVFIGLVDVACVFVKISSIKFGEPAESVISPDVVQVIGSNLIFERKTPFSPGSEPVLSVAFPVKLKE
jgi:hypothetical protein